MKVFEVRNVTGALIRGLEHLLNEGEEEPSRNGPVLVAPTPVCFAHTEPQERVLFLPKRDANPFFHLLESLWMMAGRNDVAFPARYAAQLELYSDDSETLNGAYGYRWRQHFGYDQIEKIIDELKRNPASRRCVLAMWDAMDDQVKHYPHHPNIDNYWGDLEQGIRLGKDIPCNTHVYFRATRGRLDMTVCNRSNDAVWGAHGANAVHFSVLHEYIATAAGLKLGAYYQMANNYHIYLNRPDVDRLIGDRSTWPHPDMLLRVAALEFDWVNPYKHGKVRATPVIVTSVKTWERELERFMAGIGEPMIMEPYLNPIFRVAQVMAESHALYKLDLLDDALHNLRNCAAAVDPDWMTQPAYDWLVAAEQWLKRIDAKRRAKRAAAEGRA